jgi:metal-responsive CopG/Arc/MetJ family transcriptional regulator
MTMTTAKIAISVDQITLKKLDRLVKSKVFPSRSSAFQRAIEEKLEKMDRSRLAKECAKLDPKYEQTLADEGLGADIGEWPEY